MSDDSKDLTEEEKKQFAKLLQDNPDAQQLSEKIKQNTADVLTSQPTAKEELEDTKDAFAKAGVTGGELPDYAVSNPRFEGAEFDKAGEYELKPEFKDSVAANIESQQPSMLPELYEKMAGGGSAPDYDGGGGPAPDYDGGDNIPPGGNGGGGASVGLGETEPEPEPAQPLLDQTSTPTAEQAIAANENEYQPTEQDWAEYGEHLAEEEAQKQAQYEESPHLLEIESEEQYEEYLEGQTEAELDDALAFHEEELATALEPAQAVETTAEEEMGSVLDQYVEAGTYDQGQEQIQEQDEPER